MAATRDIPGRQRGEQIEIFLRSHPVFLVWRLLPPLLLTFMALALIIAGLAYSSVDYIWIAPIGLALVAPPVIWLAWRYALWYYSYDIVTNRRVLDFVKQPFIYERLNEAQLDRVQDVQVVFPNPLAVLLKVGHVIVQTAGMAGQLRFHFVSNPNQVQARLLALVAAVQGPQRQSGPMDQLVDALRLSVESLQPNSGPTPTQPTAGGEKGDSPAADSGSNILRDMVFYHPVVGTNQRIWHRHWWILLKAVFLPVVATAVALFVLILIPAPIVDYIAVAISVITIFWLIWQIVDWYNDIYIVTDDRLVDIEKKPLFSEDRRETRLIMIQNIHYVQPNLISRLLGFGNVLVETAGRMGAFTFKDTPEPQEVIREISARWERVRQPPQTEASGEAAKEFVSLLDQYYELRRK